MKTINPIQHDVDLAKSIAAEDIRRGDYIAIMDVVHEYPSFLWDSEPHVFAASEPVCIRFCSLSTGKPLKVKSICLPFVLVKSPKGRYGTVDVRRCRLVRLGQDYAKTAWKQYGKVRKKKKK